MSSAAFALIPCSSNGKFTVKSLSLKQKQKEFSGWLWQMKFKMLFGAVMAWAVVVSIGFSVSKPVKEMIARGGPDKVAPDERPARYPALDLEDLCNSAKNPKCEALIDSFCIKTCNAKLCANYGSIRGMCRLMCEAEDLVPECSKMGPSKVDKAVPPNQQPQAPPLYLYPQG